ncbi:MAG: cytosolic protein [Chloroflexi bacterium]|nr:cytosolic protein [Chloroflexota bacterium]
MPTVIERLLRGAVDTHVHSAPDVVARRMDDFELVRAAAAAGLHAIVLKSHHTPTVARATIAAKYAAPIQVLGGIVLNTPAAGGFNVDAVRAVLRMGGRVVWMPTLSAANHQAYVAGVGHGSHLARLGAGFGGGALAACDAEGRMHPDLLPILEEVAAADAVLATGHLAPAETLRLVEEAQRVGVRRIVVTHPELPLVGMSIADQQALAARGVLMERCIRSVTATGDRSGVRTIAENIRRVGVASTIAATDYGQPESPEPPQGLRIYAEELLGNGFHECELRAMLQDNPKRLLGM